jgi:hypothetical protein
MSSTVLSISIEKDRKNKGEVCLLYDPTTVQIYNRVVGRIYGDSSLRPGGQGRRNRRELGQEVRIGDTQKETARSGEETELYT